MENNSFVQNARHVTKSERFQVIQPSRIRDILDRHGFDLVHLKSGKAKNPTRADFQTTIARYRSRDGFEIQGLNLDLIFKVPHLTGALEGVLGMFRGVCANQLNVGVFEFERIKIKHLGNPEQELDNLIPRLVAQRAKLVETVKAMQARNVTPKELAELAHKIASARLIGTEQVISIQSSDLIVPRRDADVSRDLFTVLNVVQENVLRHGVRYQFRSKDQHGNEVIRNGSARRINEQSNRAIDITGTIFDEATKLLAAG